jgi:ABC-type Fe3+ transport system substrate-binding protein
MTYNQSLLAATGAAVLKTARNVNGAIALLDFYLQPSIQAAFAKDGGLAPAYASANDLLDPATARLMATSSQNLPLTIPINNDWWSANFTSANNAFTAWATK